MNELNIEIVTPSQIVFTGVVKSCTVPGSSGAFQILKNHASILSTLDVGEIKLVKQNDDVVHYSTGGGTVEVKDNRILILAESVETAADIDERRAMESLAKAKERIYGGEKPEVDYDRAELSLKKAINRLNIKKKYM
ncbi:MAG: ATP synthase F1 subunit epsilon [Bacteroidetes bacterium]|nr:ATP synthase F1 subunit epsilon [Bacteroidota bacterium]